MTPSEQMIFDLRAAYAGDSGSAVVITNHAREKRFRTLADAGLVERIRSTSYYSWFITNAGAQYLAERGETPREPRKSPQAACYV